MDGDGAREVWMNRAVGLRNTRCKRRYKRQGIYV